MLRCGGTPPRRRYPIRFVTKLSADLGPNGRKGLGGAAVTAVDENNRTRRLHGDGWAAACGTSNCGGTRPDHSCGTAAMRFRGLCVLIREGGQQEMALGVCELGFYSPFQSRFRPVSAADGTVHPRAPAGCLWIVAGTKPLIQYATHKLLSGIRLGYGEVITGEETVDLWWVLIGLAAWFLVAVVIGLCIGRVLRRCSQVRESTDQKLRRCQTQFRE